MNESPNFGSRDYEALQYFDALEAGDLETVADYWERARHDPELESILIELEAGLSVEDGATPAVRSKQRWRWKRRSGVVASLVAASLLAGLAWSVWPATHPALPQQERDTVNVKDPSPVVDDELVVAWQRTNPVLARSALTAFSWPMEEKIPIEVGSSIPANLFD